MINFCYRTLTQLVSIFRRPFQINLKYSFYLRQIILFLLLSASYTAQSSNQIQFDHITKKDGLPFSATYSIAEDHNGFIWIGSEAGLTQFDGIKFRLFTHSENDPTSLSSNFSRCLLVDLEGKLWVGTESGLNTYDQNTEEFTLFNFDSNEISNDQKIRSLYQDSSGIIWIGSYAGLTKYDPISKSVLNFPFGVVRSIQTLNKNSLLIGTLKQGLFRFDQNSGLFVDLNAVSTSINSAPNTKSSLKSVSIIDITKTATSEFLIGTWGEGIYRLNIEASKLTKLDIDLESQHVSNIHQENNGDYWIASQTTLALYDSDFNRLTVLLAPDMKSTNENAHIVRYIYQARNRNLWVATYGNGVYRINSESSQFKFYGKNVKDIQSSFLEHPSEIVETITNEIIVGTFAGKLSKFSPDKNTWAHYALQKGGRPLNQKFYDLIPISESEILVSMESELFRLEISQSTLSIVESRQYDFLQNFVLIHPSALPTKILAMNKNSQKLVVLNVNDSGDIYIEASTNFTILNRYSEYVSVGNDAFIIAEQDGAIRKLEQLDTGDYVLTDIMQTGNSYLTGMTTNEDHDIFLSYFEKGIIVLKKNSSTGKYYSKRLLSPKNTLRPMYVPKQNSLWVTTSTNLTKIALDSKKMYFFDDTDGLQEGEFTQSSILASDGSIYIGGESGLNRFFPDKVIPNQSRVPVNLTDFYLENERIAPNSKLGPILYNSIINANDITLQYNQNNFGLEFSAFALLKKQKKLEYAYLLDGYETKWHHVDYKKRFANYTNIPPGDYAFHVKVRNKNGLWSEQDRVLKISISPPWWKTNLAYFSYLLLAVASLYMIVAFRTRILTKRSEQLANQVKQRTKEVELLLENKNREFANVSHEFRTPLTLILGPLAQVIKNLKPENIDKSIESLGLVQRNSYRLLRMVDQLLNIESFQVNSITQKQPIAFGETTRLIAEAFHEKAKENNIDFTISEVADINFDFTPDAFEKILLNLLSNAFKYTPAGGQISISTKVIKNKELQITVSDNGIGIPLDEQNSIYERFSRSVTSKQENIQGAGIGLSLVKNLVEIHQGRIELKSEVNIGSCFDVYLPIVNPVSDSEVKKHTDKELIALELMSIACQASFSATENGTTTPSQEHTNKILVIEDNDDMREFIARSIEQNYQVLKACDGEQGVRIATEEIPDLIISDIMMPKLDGYQVTSQLRSQTTTNHIPIILLTAKNDRISRLKGWHENADEYLTKPFDVDELSIRIKSLLDIRDILKKQYSGKVSIIEQNDESDSMESGQHVQHKFVNSLNRVIQNSYANHQIKVPEIASEMAMSERQLLRKMKASMDLTPAEYLRNYRIEKSKVLLTGGKNVAVTAYEVGFSSQSHFSRCFKAYVGCSPTEFGV